MKVLHVVESLDRGAVENWLVRMLRAGVRRGMRPDWTFYCALGRQGALDDEARALGARIVHSPAPLGHTGGFARALRGELKENAYDVLHCHHDLVSAVYLAAAAGVALSRRLVHVHNADEWIPTPNAIKRSALRPLMRRACLSMADRIVGISDHTLDTFLAGRPRQPGRDFVHYYGIDPAPFEKCVGDRDGFRRSLGVPAGARLLLFAGRLVPEKNPLFAAEVFAELHRLDPGVVGVFVGSGSLEAPLRARIHELGLDQAFRGLGWRYDIAEVMACCDWFILPHPREPMEGFGVAVVEAQLAGLRMLLSDGIADDPLLPTAHYRRLTLAESPRAWAEAALDLGQAEAPSRPAALAALKDSPMDMDRALANLAQLHA